MTPYLKRQRDRVIQFARRAVLVAHGRVDDLEISDVRLDAIHELQ